MELAKIIIHLSVNNLYGLFHTIISLIYCLLVFYGKLYLSVEKISHTVYLFFTEAFILIIVNELPGNTRVTAVPENFTGSVLGATLVGAPKLFSSNALADISTMALPSPVSNPAPFKSIVDFSALAGYLPLSQ